MQAPVEAEKRDRKIMVIWEGKGDPHPGIWLKLLPAKKQDLQHNWHRDTFPLYTDSLCCNSNQWGLRYGCKWTWVRPHSPHRHFLRILAKTLITVKLLTALCSRLSLLNCKQSLSSLRNNPVISFSFSSSPLKIIVWKYAFNFLATEAAKAISAF